MFRFRDRRYLCIVLYMSHLGPDTTTQTPFGGETRFRKNHNNYTHGDSINAALDWGGGGYDGGGAIHHRPSRDDRAAHVSHDEHAFHHRRIIPLTERILYVVISYPLPAAGRI